MSFQVGDMVGDYQIIALLGAGGMGKVYKVANQISDRVEAMKVLLPVLADDQSLADRFIREIKVLASLNHPNIAGLRTAFRLDNQLLMVMEFVEGMTLDERIKGGPVPFEDAINYIRQVLAALAYAHNRGVIHRDIKPANMMLTPENVIKLMDFGIAKSQTDRKLTETGTTMGSLFYMSPEQVHGNELDSRSDLYSVGVSLYELVTGLRPFHGKSDFDIMIAQLQQAPIPPLERVPGLPQVLNDVIMFSLEKEPARRFQSAEAFSAALGSIAPGLGLTSAPSPDWAPLENAPGTLPPTRIQTPDGMPLESIPSELPPTRIQVADSPPLESPPSVPPPAITATPVQPETPGTRPNTLYKIGIPLVIVAVLLTLFAFVWSRAHQGEKKSNISSPPPRPVSLSMVSGDVVYVDGSEALLGSSLKRVFVKSFYIDKTEVTNHAFLDFCHATGHTLPPDIEPSPSDNPVVNVTNDDARSFCGWAGKRLPTADEWEKAARGSNGQPYPWGSVFDYSLANLPRNDAAASTAKLTPVTAYESGKSPYGALNMLGNAWEWVDAVAPAPGGEEFQAYQRIFRDLVPPLSATEPFYYARGGSYKFVDPTPAELLSDPGSPLPARARKPDVGFRCAMDVKN